MSHLSRAETACDFTWIAAYFEDALGRCRRTGLDPTSYAGLIGALLVLRPNTQLLWSLATRTHALLAFARWASDHELLDTIAELELLLMRKHNQVADAIAAAEGVRTTALAVVPTTGIARAEVREVLSDCDAALGLLSPALSTLAHALGRIRAVPAQLGDTYVAAYNTIRRGHVLPYEARWITGEGTPASNQPPPAEGAPR